MTSCAPKHPRFIFHLTKESPNHEFRVRVVDLSCVVHDDVGTCSSQEDKERVGGELSPGYGDIESN